MPVHITWYDSRQTILLYRMYGHWSVQDFFGAMDAFLTENPAAPTNTFFFIVDLRDSHGIPNGILAAREQLFRLFVQPGELTVLVGAGRFARVLVVMIQQIGLLGDIAFADSVQAAEMLIRQHPRYRNGSP
jgi:hypothetical protein